MPLSPCPICAANRFLPLAPLAPLAPPHLHLPTCPACLPPAPPLPSPVQINCPDTGRRLILHNLWKSSSGEAKSRDKLMAKVSFPGPPPHQPQRCYTTVVLKYGDSIRATILSHTPLRHMHQHPCLVLLGDGPLDSRPMRELQLCCQATGSLSPGCWGTSPSVQPLLWEACHASNL